MPVADVQDAATGNRLDDVGHHGAKHADVLEQQVADQVLLTAVEALRIRHGDDALTKAKSGVHVLLSFRVTCLIRPWAVIPRRAAACAAAFDLWPLSRRPPLLVTR